MKKSISSICVIVLLAAGSTSQAQQTKSVTDTTVQRKEWSRLNNDITGLNAQLILAKSNLTTYLSQTSTVGVQTGSSKVNQIAGNKAVPVAEKAKQDHENASQAANQRLNSLHDRIYILSDEISRKQQRLQQLDVAEIL